MSDPRDDLAALILATMRAERFPAWTAKWGSLDSQPIDGDVNLLAVADAILARWRLVPVEEDDAPHGRCACGRPHDPPMTPDEMTITWDSESFHAEQHRAADELTQHDRDAGHYDERPREWHDYDCGALHGDKPHWHYT
jgi:hypothetical protein